MIRVIIVDDHALVRRGLRETLSATHDVAVVAESGRSEEVLPTLAAHPCDVLLLDLSMPGRGGIEVLEDVRREFPRVRVVIVSTYEPMQYAVRCFRAGAQGYVAKSAVADEVVAAVRSVIHTGRYISDDVAAALADYAVVGEASPHLALSNREFEVFRQLAAGRTVSEIAVDLSLSVKTVSTYRTRLVQKIGARSTADLLRYAIENKLFDMM
jgi:two-component system, NarL family, invasion response regulator UvrY